MHYSTFLFKPSYLENWIKEELAVLHQSEKMKELVPYISLVTKQDKSIAEIVIRSKHWKGATNTEASQRDQGQNRVRTEPDNVVHRPPGNFKLHNSKCMACK